MRTQFGTNYNCGCCRCSARKPTIPSIVARLILSLLAPLISNLNWATVGTAVQQTDTMWSRSLKPLLERECELLLQRLEVAPHKVVRRPLPVCLVANERCRSLLHPYEAAQL